MGLHMGFSSSHKDKSRSLIHFSDSKISKKITVIESKTLPNPRPDNYKIIKSEKINDYLVLKIKYLDCINYEGVKILVFIDCNLSDLLNQKLIDPHFCDNVNFYSPIARFLPTDLGWDMACEFCKVFK